MLVIVRDDSSQVFYSLVYLLVVCIMQQQAHQVKRFFQKVLKNIKIVYKGLINSCFITFSFLCFLNVLNSLKVSYIIASKPASQQAADKQQASFELKYNN